MKIWILGILALLLLFLTLRESYTNYEEALKDVGQTAGYTSLAPKCPDGSSLNAAKTMCTFTDKTKADVVPTCAKDTLEFVGGICRPKPSTTSAGSTGITTATSTGTTTGGSSDSSLGPNSGGGGDRRRQVFGPISNGRGTTGDGGVVPMDSSKTAQYPELLGGGETKPSTRIEGGGIVAPPVS